MHSWITPRSSTGEPGSSPVLYCFHHAGGSASSFGSWRTNWPAGSVIRAIQLPGRPGSGELPLEAATLDELLADLLACFVDQFPRPRRFAFYGHSLGALVAFKLAQALAQSGDPAPAFLAVSGRRAPTSPLRGKKLWDLEQGPLLDALRSMGGMPPLLLESPKWRQVFLPSMRADLRLSDEYRHTGNALVDVPVLAFRGAGDPIVQPEELEAWRNIAQGSFERHEFPGHHFFSIEGTQALQRRLQSEMAFLLRGNETQRAATCT